MPRRNGKCRGDAVSLVDVATQAANRIGRAATLDRVRDVCYVALIAFFGIGEVDAGGARAGANDDGVVVGVQRVSADGPRGRCFLNKVLPALIG